jgi:hypothetical protein
MILEYVTAFTPLLSGALMSAVFTFRLYKRSICGTLVILGLFVSINLEYYGFELEYRVLILILAVSIMLNSMFRPDNAYWFKHKKNRRATDA